MSLPKAPALTNSVNKIDPALRLVLVYAVFAALWILLSDEVVGSLFVAVTSLLLYCLTQRLLGKLKMTALSEYSVQADKNRAKQFFDHIADSSPDAIYAKDSNGHYLLTPDKPRPKDVVIA